MNDKVWVVTYYDIAYGEREPVVTCFNNEENASKYYKYIYDKYNIVSIDECVIYNEFKVYE